MADKFEAWATWGQGSVDMHDMLLTVLAGQAQTLYHPRSGFLHPPLTYPCTYQAYQLARQGVTMAPFQ
jgi:hypothetical protein